MEPFSYEEEISDENFLAWCVRDSAQLKSDFLTYRPCYQGQPPALWVEPLLGALDYKVLFCSMNEGQLGLCDMANQHIFVTSRSDGKRKVDKHYRSSTLAHELGHIRLHEAELRTVVCSDDDFWRSRRSKREREANTYASHFLVCRTKLEQSPLVRDLLESRSTGQEMSSSEIWTVVYRLARAFAVSPTMMMRCLFELGWIEKDPDIPKTRPSKLQLKRRTYHD